MDPLQHARLTRSFVQAEDAYHAALHAALPRATEPLPPGSQVPLVLLSDEAMDQLRRLRRAADLARQELDGYRQGT